MKYAKDSVELVAAKGEAAGRDKTDCEKLLIYCPAIASDTLLYYIRQGTDVGPSWLTSWTGWRILGARSLG